MKNSLYDKYSAIAVDLNSNVRQHFIKIKKIIIKKAVLKVFCNYFSAHRLWSNLTIALE